jgi:hypothetical protein
MASPEKGESSPIFPDLNGESKTPPTVVAGSGGGGGGDEAAPQQGEACQVYKFRWVVLLLFLALSMSNAFQWIQFAIINGLVGQFYGISNGVVDMTSMIFMITYIPLIFPAMYFLDKYVSLISIVLHAAFFCSKQKQ